MGEGDQGSLVPEIDAESKGFQVTDGIREEREGKEIKYDCKKGSEREEREREKKERIKRELKARNIQC